MRSWIRLASWIAGALLTATGVIGLIDLPGQLRRWADVIAGLPLDQDAFQWAFLISGLVFLAAAQFWPRRPTVLSDSPLIALGQGRQIAMPTIPDMEPEPEPRILPVTWQQLTEYRRRGLLEIDADRLIEPYRHKWMRARVTIGDVGEAMGRSDMVHVRPQRPETDEPADLYFWRREWDEHPAHKGTTINVIGRILSVHRDSVSLYDCKIVD